MRSRRRCRARRALVPSTGRSTRGDRPTALATVAAIEFVGPVTLALLAARTSRNAAAVVAAAAGVCLLTHVRLGGETVGIAFALANAALFTTYIVLAHRLARRPTMGGVDGLAAAMLFAVLFVSPVGLADAAGALTDPVAIAAGIGVGICSSVTPFVFDQLAMAKLARGTYPLFVALLPATATTWGCCPPPASVRCRPVWDRARHDRRGATSGVLILDSRSS